MAVGVASQVVAETSERGVVLLEDNGLGLDFADLLEDDPGRKREENNMRSSVDVEGKGGQTSSPSLGGRPGVAG
jgi:hypothetical protein